MMQQEFSPQTLSELKAMLQRLEGKQKSPDAQRTIADFSAMIDVYVEQKKLCHPQVLDDLPRIVSRLQGVAAADAAEISSHVWHHCRECLLHLDDCFMNLIFLTFKSLEVGRLVEPNKVRPTMRVVVDH